MLHSLIIFSLLLATGISQATEAWPKRVVKRYYQNRMNPLALIKDANANMSAQEINEVKALIKKHKIASLPLLSWDGEQFVLQATQGSKKDLLKAIAVNNGTWELNDKTLEIPLTLSPAQQIEKIMSALDQSKTAQKFDFKFLSTANADIDAAVEAALTRRRRLENAFTIQTVSATAGDEIAKDLSQELNIDGISSIKCTNLKAAGDLNSDQRIILLKMNLESGTNQDVIITSDQGSSPRITNIAFPATGGRAFVYSVSLEGDKVDGVGGGLFKIQTGQATYTQDFYMNRNTAPSSLDPFIYGQKSVEQRKKALSSISEAQSHLPNFEKIRNKCWDKPEKKSGWGRWLPWNDNDSDKGRR